MVTGSLERMKFTLCARDGGDGGLNCWPGFSEQDARTAVPRVVGSHTKKIDNMGASMEVGNDKWTPTWDQYACDSRRCCRMIVIHGMEQ